jgi:carboxylesterase type B
VGQYVGLNLFPPTEGVCHFDEMFLLFKQHLIPVDGVFTDDDKSTSRNLLKIWTDFAKTGNPTPDPNGIHWRRS